MIRYRYEETVRFKVDVTAKTKEEAMEIATEFVEAILNAADKVDTAPQVKRWDMDTTDYYIGEI